MYGHPLYRLCMLGDSGWLAWAGGHRALCAGAELSMCWVDPEALCTEGTLTTAETECVQSRGSQGSPGRGCPGGTAGIESGISQEILECSEPGLP